MSFLWLFMEPSYIILIKISTIIPSGKKWLNATPKIAPAINEGRDIKIRSYIITGWSSFVVTRILLIKFPMLPNRIITILIDMAVLVSYPKLAINIGTIIGVPLFI